MFFPKLENAIVKTMGDLITAYQALAKEEIMHSIFSLIISANNLPGFLHIKCLLAHLKLCIQKIYLQRGKALLLKVVDSLLSCSTDDLDSFEQCFGVENMETLLEIAFMNNLTTHREKILLIEECQRVLHSLPSNSEHVFLFQYLSIKEATLQVIKAYEDNYYKIINPTADNYIAFLYFNKSLEDLKQLYLSKKEMLGIKHRETEFCLLGLAELIQHIKFISHYDDISKYIDFLILEFKELIKLLEKTAKTRTNSYRILNLKHNYAMILYYSNGFSSFDEILNIYRSMDLLHLPESIASFGKRMLYNFGNFLFAEWNRNESDFDRPALLNEIISIYSAYLSVPVFYPSEKDIRVYSRLFYFYSLDFYLTNKMSSLENGLKTLIDYSELWVKYYEITHNDYKEYFYFAHDIMNDFLVKAYYFKLISYDSFYKLSSFLSDRLNTLSIGNYFGGYDNRYMYEDDEYEDDEYEDDEYEDDEYDDDENEDVFF